MKVKRLIKELEKLNPNAEVRLHGYYGHPVLFILSRANDDNIVYIETDTDCNMHNEILERIDAMKARDMSDDEIFSDFVELGIDELMLYKYNLYDIVPDFRLYCKRMGIQHE